MIGKDESAAWVVGLGSLGAAALWLRRRWSRDSAHIAADRVESKILDRTLEERDEAGAMIRQLLEQHAHDVETIAMQRERILAMDAAAQARERDEAAFRRRLVRMFPQTQAFVGSSFAPLDVELPALPPIQPPRP